MITIYSDICWFSSISVFRKGAKHLIRSKNYFQYVFRNFLNIKYYMWNRVLFCGPTLIYCFVTLTDCLPKSSFLNLISIWLQIIFISKNLKDIKCEFVLHHQCKDYYFWCHEYQAWISLKTSGHQNVIFLTYRCRHRHHRLWRRHLWQLSLEKAENN